MTTGTTASGRFVRPSGSAGGASSWLVRPRLAAPATLRLFALPYAGGSATVFRPWFEALAPAIDVCAVQLPGRGGRFKEPAFRELGSLLPALADAVEPHLDLPYALFGHSMGALVAFELARELRRRGRPAPRLLVASAHHAPHRPDPDPPLGPLDDAAFVAEIRARYDGIPEAVLAEPELLALLLPVLRADVAVLESYEHAAGEPLACPIVCCGGEDDRHTRRDDLEPWREQTTARFGLRLFPGGHFFLDSARSALLDTLRAELERCDALA